MRISDWSSDVCSSDLPSWSIASDQSAAPHRATPNPAGPSRISSAPVMPFDAAWAARTPIQAAWPACNGLVIESDRNACCSPAEKVAVVASECAITLASPGAIRALAAAAAPKQPIFPWDESNDNGAAEPQRQSGWIFHTQPRSNRSEEHTSELQSLMRTSY